MDSKEKMYEEVTAILDTDYHPDINTDHKIMLDKLHKYISNQVETLVSLGDSQPVQTAEEMTAKQFIDLILPEHGRTSCNDENKDNGLYSRNGETWHGRCSRCIMLDILENKTIPDGFEYYEAQG